MALTSTRKFGEIVALAGGVGGARMADGLVRALAAQKESGRLTVIVNIGDDFEHLGMRISPDLDTVCYTLAGLANPQTGWGLEEESFTVMNRVIEMGGPDWFRLGDRDIATHLYRTHRLKEGYTLSQITADLCKAFGIETKVLPVSDDFVPTIVYTDRGTLSFQEYFVHQKCEPMVNGFRFSGVSQAWPAPGVLEALESAEAVIICPSNPWVSVDPILAVPGVGETLNRRKADGIPVVAISPIIGGQTVKGPAAKMFRELGIDPSAAAVARHYQDLLSGFVIDQVDADLAEGIRCQRKNSDLEETSAMKGALLPVLVTDTMMKNNQVRQRLAEEVLDFSWNIFNSERRYA